MLDKTTITFETFKTQRSGYDHTHVVIRHMYVEDTEERLEGTVDNKAGYGSLDACARERVRFQRLLEAGHKTFFDHMSGGLYVHIRWQHYTGGGTLDYCEPDYEELGKSLGQIEEGLKFLKKVGRTIERARAAQRRKEYGYDALRAVSNNTFSRPEDLIAALAKTKGVLQIRRSQSLDSWVLTDVKILGPRDALGLQYSAAS